MTRPKLKSCIFLYFLSLLILLQCSKLIDVPLPDYDGVNVMNAFPCHDSTLSLTLSKSVEINNDSITRINDGIVVLFQNDLLPFI